VTDAYAVFAAASYGVSFLVAQNNAAYASVSVPKLAGATESQATDRLKASHLSVQFFREESSDIAKDLVIRSDPPEGKSVKPGTDVIKVFLSSGPTSVKIPNVSKYTQEEARKILTSAGLTVADISDHVPGNGIEKDRVVGTDPPAGQSVNRGEQVTLQISSGKIMLPNVIGKSKDDAYTAIKKAGFTGEVTIVQTQSNQPAGQVLAQDPPPGQKASVIKIILYVAIPTNDQQPADPGSPANPDSSSDPGSPADPGSSSDPGSPADPGSPSDPGSPADPRLSVRPRSMTERRQ
jgi:serine/threonine-protein kinase